MNIELRTMKAMAKEWRKRVNEEIDQASYDKDTAAEKDEIEEFREREAYIRGLKFALEEGDII